MQCNAMQCRWRHQHGAMAHGAAFENLSWPFRAKLLARTVRPVSICSPLEWVGHQCDLHIFSSYVPRYRYNVGISTLHLLVLSFLAPNFENFNPTHLRSGGLPIGGCANARNARESICRAPTDDRCQKRPISSFVKLGLNPSPCTSNDIVFQYS